MDMPQKDTRAASVSKFFDKIPTKIGFLQNQSMDRLYRRAERIVAAIFLATNHIHASESLRSQIRDAGVCFLKETLDMRDALRTQDSIRASRFSAAARYLISLIRMLAAGGLLSLQNAGVLVEAIDELGALLSAYQNSPLADTIAFSKQELSDTHVPHMKDSVSVKDGMSLRGSAVVSDRPISNSLGTRQQNVLDVLRTAQTPLSITDIAIHLPEYSTKTIQRDLVDLILAAKVRRMGEKRWSKYSLATQQTSVV